ncbi:C-GCAxxG-C-C family protein [Sedimentisphaera salicampi]|uniref:C_GCAxxG_C_C family protein n=1 Tax=Sedimentisphaera salicampi TaxID=1941349 RepID=A0A1W6LNP0_9BACT|nr:C-GCAxxG-C-C family protein [Sedimentisphaera salicampi]ARN57398.1 C_GCAxxG_C_C family protein [Sedimentisphaera salicampi]OXU14543.1 C_GCAxxG_C_C family protein [Sedimentisphaera salicampi]
MVETAKKKFHGEERYNCAQAVLSAFRDKYAVSEDCIKSHRTSGGGRAEGGTCGALYAALMLVENNPEKAEKLCRRFEQKAGHTKCRELKRLGFPCRECVGLAAELLAELEQKCA